MAREIPEWRVDAILNRKGEIYQRSFQFEALHADSARRRALNHFGRSRVVFMKLVSVDAGVVVDTYRDGKWTRVGK